MKGSERIKIRIAGAGGQGVILASIILAEAAGIHDGFEVVQSQSYGPEARGGEAYSDIIVSEGEIHFPQPDKLDVLVALNQETYDKFRGSVTADGCILANSTAVRDTRGDSRVVASPIGELLAREVRPPKRELGINVLAMAVSLGYLDLVPRPALEAAVMKSVGEKNPQLNLKALAVGFVEAERLRGQAKGGRSR